MSAVFSVAYLVLLIKQNSWCWIFAILSALLSIYLFVSPEVRLYSEAILYGFYVVIAIYGWWVWRKRQKELSVTTWTWKPHVLAIATGTLSGLGIGYIFSTYTDAEKPALDALTTSFSFIASYMEANKVLSGWLYWFVINVVTVFLYFSRSLEIYGILMVVYSVLSIVGYLRWRETLQHLINAE